MTMGRKLLQFELSKLLAYKELERTELLQGISYDHLLVHLAYIGMFSYSSRYVYLLCQVKLPILRFVRLIVA